VREVRRIAYITLRYKTIWRRRRRRSWEDLRELWRKDVDWIHVMQGCVQWRALVNTQWLLGFYKSEVFLTKQMFDFREEFWFVKLGGKLTIGLHLGLCQILNERTSLLVSDEWEGNQCEWKIVDFFSLTIWSRTLSQ